MYIRDPNSNHVHIYSPPYTGKPTVITFGSEQVHSLAVYLSTGMFAVTTQVRKDGSGRVNFFRRGEITPCAIVAVPTNYPDEAGAAFDAEGDLFFNVANQSSNGQSLIASVSGGCSAKVVQIYQFTKKVISPEAFIAFDKNDNIVLQDWNGTRGLMIYTFAHPKNGVFGSPISETKPRYYNGYLPFFLAMGSDGAHFWASFIGTTLGYYNYPAGGKPVVLLLGLDGVNGIAVLPPLVP